MKIYQKPETVNVNIKDANLIEIVCASIPENPDGPQENQSPMHAPKIV